MDKPLTATSGLELYCLAILLGECAGVIYLIGSTVMRMFNLW